MKISELQPGQGNVDVEIEIVSIDEPKQFEKYGRTLRVANALAKDDSGQIKLSLWNEDIDKVKAGQKVKITNGYVSEFQGERQLSTGKYGSMEILGSNSIPKSEEEKPIEESKEELPPNNEKETLL